MPAAHGHDHDGGDDTAASDDHAALLALDPTIAAAANVPPYLLPSWGNPDDHSVGELVSALSAHGVELPAVRAKKATYVDLFNQRVVPDRARAVHALIDIHRRYSSTSSTSSTSPRRPPNAAGARGNGDGAGGDATAARGNSFVDVTAAVAPASPMTPRRRSSAAVRSNQPPTQQPIKVKKEPADAQPEPLVVLSDSDGDNANSSSSLPATQPLPDRQRRTIATAEAPAASALREAGDLPLPQSSTTPARRRQTFAAPPSARADDISDPATPPPSSPMRFVDFRSLATPLRNLPPDLSAVRHSPAPPSPLTFAPPVSPSPPASTPGVAAEKPAAAGRKTAAPTVASVATDAVAKKLSVPATAAAAVTPSTLSDRPAPVVAKPVRSPRAGGRTSTHASPASARTVRNRKPEPELTWDSLLPATSLKTAAAAETPRRKPAALRAAAATAAANVGDAATTSPKGGVAKSPARSRPTSPTTARKARDSRRSRSGPGVPRNAVAVAAGFAVLAAALTVPILALFAAGWDRMHYVDAVAPAQTTATAWSLLPEPLDSMLSVLVPPTKSCPSGAICGRRAVVSCADPDAVLRRPLLGTLLPDPWADAVGFVTPLRALEPRCVPDTEKVEREARRRHRVEALSSHLAVIVRSWLGRRMCGLRESPGSPAELLDAEAEAVGGLRAPLGMPVAAARRALRAVVADKWAEADFDDVWSAILLAAASNGRGDASAGTLPMPPPLRLATAADLAGAHHRLFVPTQPPLRPAACAARAALLDFSRAHWPALLAAGTAIAAALVLRTRRREAALAAAVAADVVDDILDAIREEADAHDADPVRHPVPGLAVAQVRDHFLSIAEPADVAAATDGSAAEDGGSSDATVAAARARRAKLVAAGYRRSLDAHGRARWAAPHEAARDAAWDAAAARVAARAAVRETVVELRGEPHRVWQWIGGAALPPARKRARHEDVAAATVATPQPAAAVAASVPVQPSKPVDMPLPPWLRAASAPVTPSPEPAAKSSEKAPASFWTQWLARRAGGAPAAAVAAAADDGGSAAEEVPAATPQLTERLYPSLD
ncbi:hypothetical protein HK405_015293 [Cladochytrium tenue]|nr:hypothetical protein HK405_015293 [Cladochytrium tenue]